jgi:hypothetical protein
MSCSSDLPTFRVNSIEIAGEKPLISWSLDTNLVDRVLVTARDAKNAGNFVLTNVTDLERDPVSVDLPLGASSYVFDFRLFKGDVPLVEQVGLTRSWIFLLPFLDVPNYTLPSNYTHNQVSDY